MTAPPDDWFHQAALAVGFVAHAEGWLGDSERVKRAVYHLYEHGGWPPEEVTTDPDPCYGRPTPPADEVPMTDPTIPFPPAARAVHAPDGPGATDFDALIRDLLCDPDELRAFLTAALAAYDREGDAAALRTAVAVARDALPAPDDAA